MSHPKTPIEAIDRMLNAIDTGKTYDGWLLDEPGGCMYVHDRVQNGVKIRATCIVGSVMTPKLRRAIRTAGNNEQGMSSTFCDWPAGDEQLKACAPGVSFSFLQTLQSAFDNQQRRSRALADCRNLLVAERSRLIAASSQG